MSGIPSGWTLVDDSVYENANRNLSSWTYDNNDIEVPYSVNAIDGRSSNYAKGTFDFETSVELDEVQPTYLWFQHADQTADIYVDDTKVETHWGGYNAFFTDISNYVHSGSNDIKVELCNTTRNTIAPADGDFNFNATLGYVKLFTSPYLPAMNYGYDGFHITSTVSSASATVYVRTSIPTGATVVCTISGTNCSYSAESASTGSEMIFTTTINSPHLWNGTVDPYLYNVKLEIYKDGYLYHRYERPYGLRYYEYVINDTEKYGTVGNPYTGFLLNGQPYLLRGACMHNDLEGKANALTTTDIDNDFNIVQELGCNFLRLAHYPHPKEVYDKCDQLGIIVQTEVPCVNKLQMTMPNDYYDHLSIQYTDMVNQHYNHPCIMFWGIGNEAKVTDSDEGRTFAKTKIEGYASLIKSLDSERLVGIVAHALTDPSSYFGNPNIDWFGSNHYIGWYQNTTPTTSNNPSSVINRSINNTITNLSKAFALSEYGAGGTQRCHSETPSETTNKASGGARHDIEYQMWIHEGHIASLKNYPQLIFTSLWQLFDIAVSKRNEGYTICLDGENTSINDDLRYTNDKGIVERDHVTKKDTFYLYKAWWNPTPFVHICGKSYTKKSDRVIKCYSNDGNSLKLYVNNSLVENVSASNNIFTFTASNFNSGDVIRVEGTNASDTFTFE
jgi:beta-galactosidase